MIDRELRRAEAGDVAALNRLMHASRAYDGEYRAMLDGYVVTPEQVARDHVVLAERRGEALGFYSLIVGRERPGASVGRARSSI